MQHRAPELTLYRVAVAHCAPRGPARGCLGGATLTIKTFVAIEDGGPAEEDRYETRLELNAGPTRPAQGDPAPAPERRRRERAFSRSASAGRPLDLYIAARRSCASGSRVTS